MIKMVKLETQKNGPSRGYDFTLQAFYLNLYFLRVKCNSR